MPGGRGWGLMGGSAGVGVLRANGRRLGPELVVNGGMEAGDPPANWIGGIETPVLSAAADEYTGGSGAKSLDILIAPGQVSGPVWQAVPTEIGKAYHFSGWGKNIDADHLTFVVYSATWALLFFREVNSASWTNHTEDFVSTEAGVIVTLLVVGAPGQHCRFDGISLRELVNS